MSLLIKVILDASSYHIFFYQTQQIIRHPCKTKAFCPFFHLIKHISFFCTTLLNLWYSHLGPSYSDKIAKKFDSAKTCPSFDSFQTLLGSTLYLCSNYLMFFLLIFFILKQSDLLCPMYSIM